jgi:hypothetical protein
MLPQKKIMNPVFVGSGSAPLHYENCVFDGKGFGDNYLLHVSSYTGPVVIRNCIFRNNETVTKQALFISNCTSFSIQNCIFERCNRPIGIWNCTSLIKGEVLNCRFKDFHENCVQFVNSFGSGIKVNDNRFFQIDSFAYSNDVINLYNSGGATGSYFEIKRNWGRTIFPPAKFATYYGGAFVVIGDGDSGNTAGQYIDCQDNITVNTTACGFQYGVSPPVVRNSIFKNNRSWNDLRNDAVNGKSSVGLQYQALSSNNNQLSGNAHRCIRARFSNENFDPDNDIFPNIPTTSEAQARPAWLHSNILPTQIFL